MRSNIISSKRRRLERRASFAPVAFVAVAALTSLLTGIPAHAGQATERPGRGEAGMLLRVTLPARLAPADSLGKRFEAHTLDTLQAGDRVEVGRGGAVELIMEKSGRRYRLSVPANAPGTAESGSVKVNAAGTDLVAAQSGGLKVNVLMLKAVGARLAGKFSPGARIGPRAGSVAIRGDRDMGHFALLEDTVADSSKDTDISWEGAFGAGPEDAAYVTIYRIGDSAGEGLPARTDAVWRASLTVRAPHAVLPAGTLHPGQRYRWSLERRRTLSSGIDPTPLEGPLYLLDADERASLAADLSDLREKVPDTDPSDPTPLIQQALVLRHYSLWTRTADTLTEALARGGDPSLRAKSKTLLEHPLGVRPVGEEKSRK